jgi:phosphoglucosamine mutase
MRMLFGTDGIRGVAGDPPLDEATVEAVGAALGRHLSAKHGRSGVVIGQDTRESSPWIAGALSKSLRASGTTVRHAGVITTPAIALLAKRNYEAGVVISASHNPWTDNGIKIFGHDGYKLSDELEEKLEADIFSHLHNRHEAQRGDDVHGADDSSEEQAGSGTDSELLGEYMEWLTSSMTAGTLKGLRVLVDCANGASTPVAHEVFSRCGVQARFTHDKPNGRNINENSGALHPGVVAAAVAQAPGAFDLGVTFDGDADRALFSDARGNVMNGDAVLLLCARDMKARGLLRGDTVVATTMSNMGLEVALQRSGIRMLRASVGDKYVLEQMQSTGATLGGEQSGHIIFRDGDATTGDGLLTALRVMDVLVRSGKPLEELVADLKVFPQTIKNIRVREKRPFEEFPSVATAIRSAESELNGCGRVVVRYSGTEALARVMVEAESEDTLRRLTDDIAGEIQKALGVERA